MPTNRMLDKQSVATYVACLLEAAKGADRVFSDLEDLRTVRKAVNGSSQMREFLQNGSVPAKNKVAFVRDAFGGIAPEVISTVSVMAERGDVRLLGRVTEGYEAAAEAATNSVVVDVITAVPLDEARRRPRQRRSPERVRRPLDPGRHHHERARQAHGRQRQDAAQPCPCGALERTFRR